MLTESRESKVESRELKTPLERVRFFQCLWPWSLDLPPSAILLFFVAFIFTGCAGYQLGPTNGHAAREQSIQVNPFQ
ncbi:MAG: hypothetical protein ACR2H1_09475, partial [Limisphaerales bacterium]